MIKCKYPSLRHGLIGAWCPSLGATGYALLDQSGYGNHGVLTNMDAGTDWVASDGKLALDFDGVDDFVNVPRVVLNQTPTFTMWLKPSGWSGNSRPFGHDGNNLSIQIISATAARGILFGGSGGSGLQTTSNFSYIENRWQHWAISFAENVVKIYVDGIVRVDQARTGTVSEVQAAFLLGSGIGGQRFSGTIADARLYNRTLTPSEIATLASRRGIAYEIAPRQRSYFAFTGEAGPTYTLTCDVGEFALTGIDAGLQANRLLTADAGSFELTGIDAGLIASRKLTADVGEFVLTGQDADLLAGRRIAADVGEFALTGIDAGLLAGRLLGADVGPFTLTGIAANLLANRLLGANVGEFVLTGIAADLTYSGSVGPTYTLTANVGEFTLTGIDAAFVVNRRLAADTGEFILTGIDANLSYSGATSAASSMYYYLIAGS